MSRSILYEIRLLYMSFFLGAFLMASYDVLRILRIFIRHGSLAIGIEDMIYWFYAGSMTFGVLYRQNDGKLRAYAVAGVFIGMLLYDRLFSRLLMKGLKKVRNYFKIKVTSKKSR